jgi:hypothetical protein
MKPEDKITPKTSRQLFARAITYVLAGLAASYLYLQVRPILGKGAAGLVAFAVFFVIQLPQARAGLEEVSSFVVSGVQWMREAVSKFESGSVRTMSVRVVQVWYLAMFCPARFASRCHERAERQGKSGLIPVVVSLYSLLLANCFFSIVADLARGSTASMILLRVLVFGITPTLLIVLSVLPNDPAKHQMPYRHAGPIMWLFILGAWLPFGSSFYDHSGFFLLIGSIWLGIVLGSSAGAEVNQYDSTQGMLIPICLLVFIYWVGAMASMNSSVQSFDQIEADPIYSLLHSERVETDFGLSALTPTPVATPAPSAGWFGQSGQRPKLSDKPETPATIASDLRGVVAVLGMILGFVLGILGIVPWTLSAPAFYFGWGRLLLRKPWPTLGWIASVPTSCEWRKLPWPGESSFYRIVSKRELAECVSILSVETCYSARKSFARAQAIALFEQVSPAEIAGPLVHQLPFAEFDERSHRFEPGVSLLVRTTRDGFFNELLRRRRNLFADLNTAVEQRGSKLTGLHRKEYGELLTALDALVRDDWQSATSGQKSAERIRYGLGRYHLVPEAAVITQIADTVRASLNAITLAQLGSTSPLWQALQQSLMECPLSASLTEQVKRFTQCAMSAVTETGSSQVNLGEVALRIFGIARTVTPEPSSPHEHLGAPALGLVYRHWSDILIGHLETTVPPTDQDSA